MATTERFQYPVGEALNYHTLLSPREVFPGTIRECVLGRNITLGDVYTAHDMPGILEGWAGTLPLWPIEASVGVMNDPDYRNRYLSVRELTDTEEYPTILLNTAHIDPGLEHHMGLLVAWTLCIKQIRSVSHAELADTFYHADSKGRSQLEDFAATCFTTLAVGEFSHIDQKHAIPKQVHGYNNLSPKDQTNLIHIYTEIRHLFHMMERNELKHYSSHESGVVSLIRLANRRLHRLGFLGKEAEGMEESYMNDNHPLFQPVMELGEGYIVF